MEFIIFNPIGKNKVKRRLINKLRLRIKLDYNNINITDYCYRK